MTDKETLVMRIQVCTFAMDEACLFLDTHPTDISALEYYRKHKEMRDTAVNEYTQLYGPLNPYECKAVDRWEWIDGPWPWEA